MSRALTYATTVAVLFTASLAYPAALPSFEQYPAAEMYRGTPAPARPRTGSQLMYKTAIREGAKEGPNFGGQFRIVSWGCGSGCLGAVIVNSKTGDVYSLPYDHFSFGPPIEFAGLTSSEFEPMTFRLDSRLLLVRGCPNEEQKQCATFYYEWTGTSLKLVALRAASVKDRNSRSK